MRNSIGIIITQIRMPTGILTWANSSVDTVWTAPGNSLPSTMPTTIQSVTHSDK